MKRLMFIGLVMLAASIAVAEEVTPPPEIYVDQGDWDCMVSAYGEGEVHLFKDGVEVENPYTIVLLDGEEQIFVFEAYAQLAGCLPSERVYREVHVPPLVPPDLPVLPDGGVIVTVTDSSVILEAYIADNEYIFIGMYVDGCPVDNPCTLPRVNEHYWVEVKTVFGHEGYEPLDYIETVMVTALEGQAQDVNGDGEVNIVDVNCVIDHIMHPGSDSLCDVNGDGEVNIADVNMIINYILSF